MIYRKKIIINNFIITNAYVLFQHANSLKSALTIAAALRNERNKDLNVEGVYDSICDIETELKNRNDTESNHH